MRRRGNAVAARARGLPFLPPLPQRKEAPPLLIARGRRIAEEANFGPEEQEEKEEKKVVVVEQGIEEEEEEEEEEK